MQTLVLDRQAAWHKIEDLRDQLAAVMAERDGLRVTSADPPRPDTNTGSGT
ncbi:MAG: hypothetical protein ABW167_05185 [Baekduia sp.]